MGDVGARVGRLLSGACLASLRVALRRQTIARTDVPDKPGLQAMGQAMGSGSASDGTAPFAVGQHTYRFGRVAGTMPVAGVANASGRRAGMSASHSVCRRPAVSGGRDERADKLALTGVPPWQRPMQATTPQDTSVAARQGVPVGGDFKLA